MNWGQGITIALGSFITFIVILIIGFFSNNVDLEHEDYYQREMAYEEEIQAVENVNQLKEKISFERVDEFMVLKVPEGKFEDIRLDLRRPNDKTLDKQYNIKTTEYAIPVELLKKGHYYVSISYLADGKICLQKDKIYI